MLRTPHSGRLEACETGTGRLPTLRDALLRSAPQGEAVLARGHYAFLTVRCSIFLS